ncbi:C4b-binding protein alpha chain-like isoform X3 [Lampris incognitus]|uniref:C4b-binding protein alpha chain-like isoform X3 n=1 Tax=Lampris incognitus TaxID=2546036 RepID=UPI0024B60B7C|nr:C4b-binding protein alpha chain-like isoform X3 [Lampris incognitus]
MRPACFLIASLLALAGICQGQTCGPPTPGDNANVRPEDAKPTYDDKETITLVCDVGYTNQGGSPTITCQAGAWSPVNLRCGRKDCGNPGQVPNGEIHIKTDTLFGDRVTVTCNIGYYMIGQDELLCGDKGWLGRLPVCEVVKCLQAPAVENAYPPSPADDVYTYGQVVKYTCLKDYTLNGSSSLTCSEDKKFKPDPPTCIKVVCPSLDVPNGRWIAGARPPYGYKDFVEFQCNNGFVMQGSPSVRCELNSKWSPEPPVCSKLPTKAPTTPKAPTTTSSPRTTKKIPETVGGPATTTPPNNGAEPSKWQPLWLIVLLKSGAFLLTDHFNLL